MVKNDIKYIIKKVIIGVLVFSIVFLLKKNGVLAETRNAYFYNMNRSNLQLATFQTSQSSFYVYGVGTLNATNTLETDIELPYGNETIKLNYGYANTGSVSTRDCIIYSMFKNENDNLYMIIQANASNNTTCNNLSSGNYGLNINFSSSYETQGSYYLKNLSTGDLTNFNDLTFRVNLLSTDTSLLDTIYNNYPNNSSVRGFYDRNQTQGIVPCYGYYSISSSNAGYKSIKDFINAYDMSIVSSNVSLYFDNVEQVINNFPPSGYSELSLNNNAGAIFIAKNYDDLNLSQVGNLYTTTFDYYYQGQVRDSYVPIDKLQSVRFNSTLLSADIPTLKSSYYPALNDETGTKIPNVFVIYNASGVSSDYPTPTTQFYGDSKVWYNSNLYNAYLVDDFSTFSQSVSYIVDNDNNTYTIEGLPTMVENLHIAQVYDSSNFDQLPIFRKVANYFQIFKLPFYLLDNVGENACSPILLPIPFLNSNINLPCFSTIYHIFLPNQFFNVIVFMINAFFIYLITTSNIRVIGRCLNPNVDNLTMIGRDIE